LAGHINRQDPTPCCNYKKPKTNMSTLQIMGRQKKIELANMYMETLINFYLGQMSQLTSQKIVIHGKIWQRKSKSMLTGPYIKFSATDYVNERTTKMI
jgi:hypothetical protein